MDFAAAMNNTKEAIQQQLAHRDALIVQAKRRADDVVDSYSKLLVANTGAAVFRQAMDIASKAVLEPGTPDATYRDVFTSNSSTTTETAAPSAASAGNGTDVNAHSSLTSRMLGPALAALGIAGAGAAGYLLSPKPETTPALVQPATPNGSLKEALRKEGLNLPPLENQK